MSVSQDVTAQSDLVRRFKKYKVIYLLISIPVLVIFVYQYIPMLGIFMSFTDFKMNAGFLGIFTSPFVGLKHFYRLFGAPYFYQVLVNTVLINVYGLVFGFPVPVIFALLLNEVKNMNYKKFVQTVSYMPYFLSTVIVYGIVLSVFSPSYGLLNMIIGSLGGEPKHFIADPAYFRSIAVAVQIWQTAGFAAVIYIAAITSIEIELYEAAIIDGATKLKQIWYVTLPGIASMIILNLILSIGSLLNSQFEMIFQLYSPSVYSVADVIDTYVYRVGLGQLDFSYGAAAGLFKSVFSLALIVLAQKIATRYQQAGVWQ